MATATILLSIPAGGYDATNPPALLFEDNQWALVFDDGTDEICYWSFRMPENYASALVLKCIYKMDSATTAEVMIRAAIRATADGEDPASSAFDTDNISAEITVPATAELLDTISLTMTNADSIAANEHCTLRFARDANNVGDDASGDMKVVAVSLEYTVS